MATKKGSLVLIALLFNVISLIAHDASQAYFTILEGNVFRAEFPWTIRNALLKFDSTLNTNSTQKEFDSAFKYYVEQNFIAFDAEGKKIALKNVSKDQTARSVHNHAVVYYFQFTDKEIVKIKNTLMFNINKDQQNVFIEKLSKTDPPQFYYITKDKPVYYLNTNSTMDSIETWSILGAMVLIIIGIFVFEKWVKVE